MGPLAYETPNPENISFNGSTSLTLLQCQGPPVDISKIDNGLKYKDSDGNPWVPGDCKCSFPIAKAIADIVLEALKDIDKVLCAVMVNAAKLTVEIGVDLIPGGAELGAAEKLVEGAKTWAENGLKVADFFGNWVGKVFYMFPHTHVQTFISLYQLAGY